MRTKPIYLSSTLNFGLLDNQDIPGSVGIVFLYKPGTDSLNFRPSVFLYSIVNKKKPKHMESFGYSNPSAMKIINSAIKKSRK